MVQFGQKQTPAVAQPTVEVSYDDGVTWAKAKVEKKGQTWNVVLDHPRKGDYVSLRASAQDRAGNSVKQTLIRAYPLAGCHERRASGSN